MGEAVLCSLIIISVIINVIVIILLISKNNKKDYELLMAENKKNSEKIDRALQENAQNISKEFSRSRMENAQSQTAQRQELSQAVAGMTEKLEKMIHDNYEFNAKVTAAISQSLTQIRTENSEKLEKIRLTVDEKLNETLTKRLDSSFRTVSEQLENVYKSLGEMKILSTGVTENVTSLNRILTNVKARGTWAEVQLEGILDQTIPNMYEKNVATVPGSIERVEFAIRIPSSEKDGKDILLPVDSKFPMEDYIRLCDAADRADADALKSARSDLEKKVLSEAKMISKYIHVPDTTPFAIMYLATEGLYAEIASSKSGLPEKIQSDYNIMIAGPSTVTALLNSLSMGFKTIAINEKANEVREILGAAKAQYEKFGTLLAKARKKVDEAGKTLDEAERKNLFIQRKLKNIEAIDDSKADSLLYEGSFDNFSEDSE